MLVLLCDEGAMGCCDEGGDRHGAGALIRSDQTLPCSSRVISTTQREKKRGIGRGNALEHLFVSSTSTPNRNRRRQIRNQHRLYVLHIHLTSYLCTIYLLRLRLT